MLINILQCTGQLPSTHQNKELSCPKCQDTGLHATFRSQGGTGFKEGEKLGLLIFLIIYTLVFNENLSLISESCVEISRDD